jgi:hypothetical protein
VRRIAAALLHYPVVDRHGRVVTTAITNLDLHDIARSAHTYALEAFFVVHPVAAQRALAERVQRHWTHGSGARRIPDRTAPMSMLRVVSSLEDAVSAFDADTEIWTTSARRVASGLSFENARARLRGEGGSVLIVFGTGWGLCPELYASATAHLDPILSPRPDGYNHLSVRAAAAIVFDRLMSP